MFKWHLDNAPSLLVCPEAIRQLDLMISVSPFQLNYSIRFSPDFQEQEAISCNFRMRGTKRLNRHSLDFFFCQSREGLTEKKNSKTLKKKNTTKQNLTEPIKIKIQENIPTGFPETGNMQLHQNATNVELIIAYEIIALFQSESEAELSS